MNLCPDCLKAGVIATQDGPTCTHGKNTGTLWWPTWWETATEARRIVWLQERSK